MTLSEFWRLVRTDHYRYTGQTTWHSILKSLMYKATFRFTTVYRLCEYLKTRRLWLPIYVVARIVLRHFGFRYGISIPMGTQIGFGFNLLHPGGIVINKQAVIGNNCTVSQNVTIGKLFRGKRKGVPTIGDRVFIGPGARILGNIHVGNDAVIGANAVVTEDIPDKSVVAAPPGQIIASTGSVRYIGNPWQD